MRTVLAIDGACRRNGKPDCVAAGGIFGLLFDDDGNITETFTNHVGDTQSTNQRGEIIALIQALKVAYTTNAPTMIITDSEYLFNAMCKEWYSKWCKNNWKTATGTAVKNADLWRHVIVAYEQCEAAGIEVSFHHIKGHCIPFGKATASTLLEADPYGRALYDEVLKKYDNCISTKKAELDHAQDLSERNNGYRLTPEQLRLFVATNTVADIVATECVERLDASYTQ